MGEDPVCNLDEHNWCERHKVHHEGHLRDIALRDDQYGASYRKMWDRNIDILREDKERIMNAKNDCCGGNKEPMRPQLPAPKPKGK